MMSEYEKCPSVLILYANHKVMSKSGYFIFCDIFNVSAETKGKIFPDFHRPILACLLACKHFAYYMV